MTAHEYIMDECRADMIWDAIYGNWGYTAQRGTRVPGRTILGWDWGEATFGDSRGCEYGQAKERQVLHFKKPNGEIIERACEYYVTLDDEGENNMSTRIEERDAAYFQLIEETDPEDEMEVVECVFTLEQED